MELLNNEAHIQFISPLGITLFLSQISFLHAELQSAEELLPVDLVFCRQLHACKLTHNATSVFFILVDFHRFPFPYTITSSHRFVVTPHTHSLPFANLQIDEESAYIALHSMRQAQRSIAKISFLSSNIFPTANQSISNVYFQ